jgi:FKBP-type peptidyl-prolyl cis-trans isomerase (trigger factor)
MSDLIPIDESKLVVKITEVNEVDQRCDIEVPADLVTQFLDNLEISKVDLEPAGLQKLMTEFCVNVVMNRFEQESSFGGPALADAHKLAVPTRGEPFRMVIFRDIVPEVVWPDFSSLAIRRPVRALTEVMIDQEMMNQRLDIGIKSTQEGPYVVNDDVEFGFNLREHEGGPELVAFDSLKVRIPPSSKSFSVGNLVINGLAPAIIGRSAGERFTFESIVPRGIPNTELEGRPAIIEVQLHRGWRSAPATVDQVLEHYGTPSEMVLREQIRHSLQHRIDGDQIAAVIPELFKVLQKMVRIPIPERIKATSFRKRVAFWGKQLEDAGTPREEIGAIFEKGQGMLAEDVERVLFKQACVTHLVRKFKVSFSESDLTQRIADMAAQQRRRPEELRHEVAEDPALQSTIKDEVMVRKVTAILLDLVTFVDVDADVWNQQTDSNA